MWTVRRLRSRPYAPPPGRPRHEAAKGGIFAYVTDGDARELQSTLDIVLCRFAEYPPQGLGRAILRSPSGNVEGMESTGGRRLLTNAGKLVAASWTQNADARAADGSALEPWDRNAVSWSLLGALVGSYERFLTLEKETVALGALSVACLLLAEVIDSDSLADWNDLPERTQAHVVAAIDTAARRVLHPQADSPDSSN